MSSLPIIDKFLWSVVVSTVPLYAEDQLKIRQKALKSLENTRNFCMNYCKPDVLNKINSLPCLSYLFL